MNAIFTPERTCSECNSPPPLSECLSLLRTCKNNPQALPFAGNDTSCGIEKELQVCVKENLDTVDLPPTLSASQCTKVTASNLTFRVQTEKNHSLT